MIMNIMPDEYFEILNISFIHIKKIKLMMEKVIIVTIAFKQ